MRDRRWRKILRDAWLHKARTLLVLAAMTIGLIASGALLDARALIERVTATTYVASDPVSATLRLDAVDAALVDAVRALPAVAAARARRTVSGSTQGGASARHAELVALDDFTRRDMARLQPDGGAWPPPDGALVIERSSLEFSGGALGEALLVTRPGGEALPLNVAGIVRDVSVAPGWMENVVYGFVTPATLQRLGAPAGFDELQFRVADARADRAAVRRVAAEVRALAERAGHRVISVDVPEPGRHIHAAQMDSLLLTQGAFGALTLLVCALLVVNLVAAMLAGQVREIGVMKALGAGSAQIARMYFAFALGIGLVASVLSLAPAMLIGRAYAGFKAEMLNFPLAGQAVPWWAIAIQMAAGCVVPIAAAAFPVVRGCRRPVAVALRDVGVADAALRRGRRLPAIDGIRRRLPALDGVLRPLLLSIGNAFRRRGRLVLTLLTLAAGGAVFLGAANLRAAVTGSVERLFATQHFDVALRFGSGVERTAVEAAVRGVDGIAAAEAWGGARAVRVLDDGTEGDAFSVLAVPPASALIDGTVERGRWLEPGDTRALVVGRALLRADGALDVGNEVPLTIDGRNERWTVVGVVNSGPAPVAYVTRDALAALRGVDRAAVLALRTAGRSPALQLDVIARLRDELAQAGVAVAGSQRLDETRRAVEDHLLMVVQFLGAMAWVMILVGGMSLASTMSLGVLERTREIGVLRAIGARHRDIAALVATEAVFIALLAGLAALPLSIPVGVVLGDAFGRIMFPLPRIWLPPAGSVAAWLALAVAVALIACAWPARGALRVTPAAALAYE